MIIESQISSMINGLFGSSPETNGSSTVVTVPEIRFNISASKKLESDETSSLLDICIIFSDGRNDKRHLGDRYRP